MDYEKIVKEISDTLYEKSKSLQWDKTYLQYIVQCFIYKWRYGNSYDSQTERSIEFIQELVTGKTTLSYPTVQAEKLPVVERTASSVVASEYFSDSESSRSESDYLYLLESDDTDESEEFFDSDESSEDEFEMDENFFMPR